MPSMVSAGTCKETAVSAVCDCGHSSWSGYQCNKCKDKFAWGYGCDLQCSRDKCPFGCDFSGNCNVPAECKRNGRVEDPTDHVINDRGECQACESGYHGLYCTKRCPKNCGDSAEGLCSRGGFCYKCKKGFYGKSCDQTCPASCPECVFDEKLIKAPDGESFLPAGSCPEQCKVDKWGSTCSEPCPANCKKTQGLLESARIPSCLKENGNCVKCTGAKFWGEQCENACSQGCGGEECHKDSGLSKDECKAGWWGTRCDKQCSAGCNEGACDKTDGKCESGCNAGFSGERCDQTCPEGTGPEGCDQVSGQPETCSSGSFPYKVVRDGHWTCKSCPDNCVNNQCDIDGKCTAGCEASFYGEDCTLNCPPHCEGPCDTTATGGYDGYCTACETGWTGKKCTKRCHNTCAACNQRGDAVGEEDCTVCNLAEPVELVNGHCQCIEGASRDPFRIDPHQGLADNKCHCDDPSDEKSMKMGRFELKPHKVCRFICKEGLREVFGNKESICLTNEAFKSVIRAEVKGLQQGDCQEGESAIPISGKAVQCIRNDFVDDIIQA